MDCKKIDVSAVLEQLNAIKYKNQYSKYKNAFLKFCDFLDIELDSKTKQTLEFMHGEKKKKYRKLKHVKLCDIKNHLRVMKDQKLRLSYEAMLRTGLRVSELCQLKKVDCLIQQGSIIFSFIGKGGAIEKAVIVEATDKRFFDDLLSLIEKTRDGDKLFYSPAYLQAKAREKNFACHDLRRVFSKLTYRDCKNINTTMKLLRHSKLKHTQIYLNSKVEI